MERRFMRGLLPAALCGLALVWGGPARAYLSPLNPDAVAAGVIPAVINDPNYVIGPGSIPDYLTTPNWAYTPIIRKFVDTLPGLTAAGANNLGQYIPLANPDVVTYPGSDYYEIEVVQYAEQMHSDLPPTTLRGYRQTNNGTNTGVCGGAGQPACTAAHNTVAPPAIPHYLGPLIISQKDRPVRVKFMNHLPTGAAGELFVPVDTTVMGSGPFEINYDPVTKASAATKAGDFAQNRATLHLHGGRSPWISDGTPHQWITPVGEVTDYPTGVSVENVPDMPDPGPGAQTFYWTNQQSSRMMFYHDHAWGITRLNVYVGEAAGYLIQDPVEHDLVNGTNVTGVNPGLTSLLPADQIPLVIEDKTFVDAATVRLTDPTWNWGTGALDPATGIRAPNTGDLWWPHVYMPAQNPFDITGIAPMGRWAYGPYFYPATPNPYQPVPNPYYDPNCDPTGSPLTTPGLLGGPYGMFCQPLEIPGTPSLSWGAEAFMDTQTVNGAAYPTVTLEPKPYRLRILNASHDRFLNLALYQADTVVDPNTALAGDPLTTASAALCAGTCATQTEMKMVPATPQVGAPATWPVDGRAGGVPDHTTAGPSWIMFGTEGGFLPKPVVIPPHPLTWNTNPSMFNVGNINGGSLILGPAERADVVVDFSTVAPGTTLILYNDGAAPWPALNPTYDYYTGDPDQRDVGGADTTLPGFGPNTRTVMQIKIAGTTGTRFGLGALQEAFTSRKNHPIVPGDTHPSVFETAQDPIIAAQGDMNRGADPAFFEAFLFPENFDAYTKAYDPLTPFPTSYPNWGISRINDHSINFVGADGSTTYRATTSYPAVNNSLPMERKAIHDEMGATWDDYGRMRAGLGLEFQGTRQNVNFIIQTYSDPSTEILTENGIQVWKITHNGVDTHPIHFHLFDVQILNRVGWDGFIRLPDPTELGWKDTVRISPLEDTIVALKPVTPKVPFGIPESYRPKNPAAPLGSNMELTQIDPFTGNPRVNLNSLLNFDWEYVWHCHILSHEENDMMRPMIYQFGELAPGIPTGLAGTLVGAQINLTWGDPTPAAAPATLGDPANEIGFRIERATVVGGVTGTYSTIGTALANATAFADTTVGSAVYSYRVVSFNAVGDSLPSTSIRVGGPLGVTLAAFPASPRSIGTSVLFSATATGGTSSTYEYQYLLRSSAAAYAPVGPYGPAANWTWDTTGLAADTYYIRVNVRAVGNPTVATAAVGYVLVVPPATGVTFTPAPTPASPQNIGTVVHFTASASGGTGNYEYQYQWQAPGGGAYTPVGAFSATATWDWNTTGWAAGTYSVRVLARTLGSATTVSATTSYAIRVAAATSVTFTPAPTPASPQSIGTVVRFTAAAAGGSGTYEYQYLWRSSAGAYAPVGPYTATTTWDWNTAGLAAGTYFVRVNARSVGSATVVSTATGYVLVVPPVTGVTFTPAPSPASPQNAGTVVHFTAAASGGSGSYEYQYAWRIAGGVFTNVGAFSATATWDWNTAGRSEGTYEVRVTARSVGSATTVAATTSYVILVPAATSVAFTPAPTPASPQSIGTVVRFTAAAAGGSGTYEYQYQWRSSAGAYAPVGPYTTTATWDWNTAGLAADTYFIRVYARNVGSATVVTNAVGYVIVVPPATGVTFTPAPAPASPQNAGAVVRFTAAASGGTGSYEYQYAWRIAGGVFANVGAFSATTTWDWNTAGLSEGTYEIRVSARTVGSATSVTATTSYVIQVAAATSVTFTPAPTPASPLTVGTTVVHFTAAAAGGTGNYEYQYLWRSSAGAYVPVGPYTATATWDWDTTGLAADTYFIRVNARSVGSATVVTTAVGYVIR